MNKHIKIIIFQGIFLLLVLGVLYFLYPKTSIELTENLVNFKTINANVIIISENPDFSNPRYLEVEKGKEISFSLNPGKYYWKSSNGYIEGMKKEFTINSEVGMKINTEENESNLVNIGNVKISVRKNNEGVMVGRIILEPDEEQEIENKENETYIGEQEE